MTILGSYTNALLGGGLIGLSAALMLLLNGRVTGVSGILAGTFQRPDGDTFTRLAFVIGLCGGPILYLLVFGMWPSVRVNPSLPIIITAGLLVGFGTRLGSGCTSGHGVCGLARLSPRSIVAVAVFVGTGIVTVFVMNRWIAA
jgi:uncharacterized membrane protein YedE/YeeE